MELCKAPNIGKVLETQLNQIGINSVEELREIGSIEAVIRLNTIDKSCYNKLYALEGAIQGIRWHQLSKEFREQLKTRLNESIR